jgi:hypothetical protein
MFKTSPSPFQHILVIFSFIHIVVFLHSFDVIPNKTKTLCDEMKFGLFILINLCFIEGFLFLMMKQQQEEEMFIHK